MLRRELSIAVICIVLGTGGCRSIGQPADESMIDREVVRKQAPNPPPAEMTQEEPRPGFEQEPSGSQTQ